MTDQAQEEPQLQPLWKEHKTAEGRRYWYNTQTRQSVWQKPDELKTATEKLLDLLPWKEFKTKEGRLYWHHARTKESTWTCPPELQELKNMVEEEIRSGVSSLATSPTRSIGKLPSSSVSSTVSLASTKSEINEDPDMSIPEFSSIEEAKSAFIQLLKDENVNPDDSWEQCMRKVITKPMYRSLPTVMERKEVFRLYQSDRRRELRKLERNSFQLRRDNFENLLKDHKVSQYSRYGRVAAACGNLAAWKAMKDEQERQQIFDDYISHIRQIERDQLDSEQKQDFERIKRLFNEVHSQITEDTTWNDFLEQIFLPHLLADSADTKLTADQIQESVRYNLNLLQLFEGEIRRLESEAYSQRKQEKETRFRIERIHRDQFKELLDELKSQGSFIVTTKWKELFPLIKNDERFLNMLKNERGSTPLDIYRFYVVDIEEEVYRDGKTVQSILRDSGFTVIPETKYEQFESHLLSINDPRMERVKHANLKVIFDVLLDKAIFKVKEAKKREEQLMNELWKEFKYYAKRTRTKITYMTAFEDVWDWVGRHMTCDRKVMKELHEKYRKRLREREDARAEGRDPENNSDSEKEDIISEAGTVETGDYIQSRRERSGSSARRPAAEDSFYPPEKRYKRDQFQLPHTSSTAEIDYDG